MLIASVPLATTILNCGFLVSDKLGGPRIFCHGEEVAEHFSLETSWERSGPVMGLDIGHIPTMA